MFKSQLCCVIVGQVTLNFSWLTCKIGINNSSTWLRFVIKIKFMYICKSPQKSFNSPKNHLAKVKCWVKCYLKYKKCSLELNACVYTVMDTLFPQGSELLLQYSFKMELDLWENMLNTLSLFSNFPFLQGRGRFLSLNPS